MTISPETINCNGFSVTVIRTKRKKTVSVQVRDGDVLVLVPRFLANVRIEELVNQKSRWIREKMRLQRESTPVKPKEYVSGECFTYLGRQYRLKLVNGKPGSVKLKNGRLVITLPDGAISPDKLKDALSHWYRSHAEQILREKVERYARIIRVRPASMTIKSFKSRWGSCSDQGHIQFNWKIIIAPHRVVDYVVVHELCHLIEPNHSPRYWKLVEQVFPEYKECKTWLKENGNKLTI